MNSQPPAPQLPQPDQSDLDIDSSGTWNDDGSSADDSDEECSLDEGCADEEFWEDETATNAWLARFPGGTSGLYPQLFLVKPRGKVVTQPRYPDTTSLLHLPSEIRNRIYKHYFDTDEETIRPEENYAPFHNRDGVGMQRIVLGSDNVELKFWLSTALMQTSRQLRHEATYILFSNRVITVEWLPALQRLAKFLGKEGCGMVRYLDIWDILDVKGEDVTGYRETINSIRQFPGVLHLRISVTWGDRQLIDPTFSWLDATEWDNGAPRQEAIPKMRAEDLELHWPEYGVLKKLKADKFTLAAIGFPGDRYLEFDRSYGLLPDIIESIEYHADPMQSKSANIASSISPEVLDPFGIQPIALTPNSELDESPDSPTWQDTDFIAKTIPFYNFFREFFHNNPPLGPQLSYMDFCFHQFLTFPTARPSTGAIIRDCVFCYIGEQHCEYHSMPDQPPFEPVVPEEIEDED